MIAAFALLTLASTGAASLDDTVTSEGFAIPPAPETPDGPLAGDLIALLETLVTEVERTGSATPATVESIAAAGDPRTVWLLTDVLRFAPGDGPATTAIVAAIVRLMGAELPVDHWTDAWKTAIDHAIAWDLPAPPGYVDRKQRLFTWLEPGWAPFFEDEDSRVDWRHVTWGGVLIDDRPLGTRTSCERGCIPALDDPKVTPAASARWLPDDALVFGVTVGGESRAYPVHQMETHEMVNDTLGGRRFALPYCTLCASAQLWFTDVVPDPFEPPVLRTSGLLARSNKVSYDLLTHSIFDTFTGRALSGPLREAGVQLEQGTVVRSTWSAWRRAHPDTTVVAEDGGIGRLYSWDPLGGRDDDGPIFPVGDVDERLPVQELVIGVELGAKSIAFPAERARAHLERGAEVEHAGVTLALDGSGFRARSSTGESLATHASFWFAWSQFHPTTELWQP